MNQPRDTAVIQVHLRCVGTCCIVLLLAALGGCTSTIRTTDPPRTATEQFLLSQAAAEAVEQLNVDPLRGRSVHLDADYFAASEQAFVLGELRAKLLLSGVQLTTRDESQIVLEVRSGGVGIDRSDFLLGVPSLVVNAGEGQTEGGVTRTPFATPELAIIKNINQSGVASVAFVAYWTDTGELVARSGPHVGRTLREDWWFFGFGPRTIGDIAPTESD